MATTITFGIQKGGASKTTTAGTAAYLLNKQGYKVLAVDLDSQGNLTELLTQVDDIYEFGNAGLTSLDALKKEDANGSIIKLTDTLHVLASTDLMATFQRYLYEEYQGNKNYVLKNTLASVQDQYDFILIDTPPSLSETTVNAFFASDYVVIMFETARFCYSALPRFLETLAHVYQAGHRDLQIAGILRCLTDKRKKDTKDFIHATINEYPEINTFDTVITRTASASRLPIYGFFENDEVKEAVSQYEPFIKELLEVVS